MLDYNGSKYSFIHNLQGDIVGILDSNGTEVVKYMYDAWGKPIAKTGTMAATLGIADDIPSLVLALHLAGAVLGN